MPRHKDFDYETDIFETALNAIEGRIDDRAPYQQMLDGLAMMSFGVEEVRRALKKQHETIFKVKQ